ncbi:MAG: hydroxymethylglutaryl-CoA lyase [Actinobacteria bacterium]|nr:hydroxymethylglutaryl-CoA lyase [Actinomycetota bacterium]
MSTSRVIQDLPESVTIVEVGPRDGLQNESAQVPTSVKIGFIERLAAAGLPVVEATSFVNPQWVPQLADAEEVLRGLARDTEVSYPVLVPNERGLDRALAVGVKDIAIFASATETFSQKNLGRSREEAISMFQPVVRRAIEAGLGVRGYLSMVLGDPWEGFVQPDEVVEWGMRLFEMGCEEVSLGDTIGVGTAGTVQDLIGSFIEAGADLLSIAVHFHDTYGQGLANVLAALQMGVSMVDASAGGIGGCPFAKSATGNLATEDLCWMLEGLEIETGVDVDAVAKASVWMCSQLGITPPGRVARALTVE